MLQAIRIALLILVMMGLIPLWAVREKTKPTVRAGSPKLLVLIVFDQMRGDYLARWSKLYGNDGFNRLTSEGAWFNNCHYPYSMTVTGAGHATLGTGCIPAQHGIIENDWYDRRVGKSVNCATLGDRYKLVPDGSKSKTGRTNGGSPERLLEPALGNVVKEVTGSRGKVIGISLKDRGGVLPTGAKADICYWYDNTVGSFVTSDYYAGKLPSYMTEFNNQKMADQWFGHDWNRLRKDINYSDYSGPDDVVGEGTGTKQGRVFPHPMTGGEEKPGTKFYDAIYTSPRGNDLIWAAAKVLIQNEKLGKDEQTDYLVISFSSNDAVGHAWGPDSQEVLDITLRSDKMMAEIISHLDAEVGRDHYLIALSADHGICPIPDVAKSQGKDAGRVDAAKEVVSLELHLSLKYQRVVKWIDGVSGAGLYLNYRAIKAAGRSNEEVESVVAAWLSERPYVQEVYTRSQILSAGNLSHLGMMNKNSFHPDRSGDVMPLLKPYWFISKYTTGTTHGSPNEYDTHVPLVFFGANIKPGIRTEKVSPQLAAVTLAHSLGQKMKNSKVEMPGGVFK